ncbi:MAG TPA: RHS repeat domain-containing protein [Chthoniobacterales bacterium]
MQTYGYDAIDQVTSVNYGIGRSETFAYDAVGNRTSDWDKEIRTVETQKQAAQDVLNSVK